MQRRIKISGLLASLLVVASIQSCYYDNVDEIHPASGLFTTCDTTGAVSFQNDVLPVMKFSCGANNTCHSSGSSSSQVALDTYASVLHRAQTGELLGTILHESGYHPMPQGGGQLDDCSTMKIEAWINRGTPNN